MSLRNEPKSNKEIYNELCGSVEKTILRNRQSSSKDDLNYNAAIDKIIINIKSKKFKSATAKLNKLNKKTQNTDKLKLNEIQNLKTVVEIISELPAAQAVVNQALENKKTSVKAVYENGRFRWKAMIGGVEVTQLINRDDVTHLDKLNSEKILNDLKISAANQNLRMAKYDMNINQVSGSLMIETVFGGEKASMPLSPHDFENLLAANSETKRAAAQKIQLDLSVLTVQNAMNQYFQPNKCHVSADTQNPGQYHCRVSIGGVDAVMVLNQKDILRFASSDAAEKNIEVKRIARDLVFQAFDHNVRSHLGAHYTSQSSDFMIKAKIGGVDISIKPDVNLVNQFISSDATVRKQASEKITNDFNLQASQKILNNYFSGTQYNAVIDNDQIKISKEGAVIPASINQEQIRQMTSSDKKVQHEALWNINKAVGITLPPAKAASVEKNTVPASRSSFRQFSSKVKQAVKSAFHVNEKPVVAVKSEPESEHKPRSFRRR